jgi:acyl carrier protein
VSEIIPAIGLLVVLVVPFVIWIARIVRRQREVWRAWCERPQVRDDDFLRACELPDENPWTRGLALATRNALAEASGVPPGTIKADDSFQHEVWDSLDWLDIIFRIEKAAAVKIPWSPALDRLYEPGSGPTVAELVRAIIASSLRDGAVRKHKRPSPV